MGGGEIRRMLLCAAAAAALVTGVYSRIYCTAVSGQLCGAGGYREHSCCFGSSLRKEGEMAAADGRRAEAQRSVLRIGDSGERVARLQRRLAELGCYSGEPDGEYGLELAEAVRRYQSADGLPVDGNAGLRTLLSLGLGEEAADNSGEPAYESALMRLARAVEKEAAGEPLLARTAVAAILLRRGAVTDPGGEADALSLLAAAGALRGTDPLGEADTFGRSRPEAVYVKIGKIYFS